MYCNVGSFGQVESKIMEYRSEEFLFANRIEDKEEEEEMYKEKENKKICQRGKG